MKYTILYKQDDGKRIKKYVELEYYPQVGNYLSFNEKLYRIDDIEIIPYLWDQKKVREIRSYGVPLDIQSVILYCTESKTFDLKSRKHKDEKFDEFREE